MASQVDIKGWITVVQEKVLNENGLSESDRAAIMAGLCLVESLVTDLNRIADALEHQSDG